MVRLLRRLVLLSLLIGGIAFVLRRRCGARSPATSDQSSAASWPLIATEARPVAQVETSAAADTGGDRWAPSVDGQCPDCYPIKANSTSRIFHVPGGRFYDRSVPDRCYAEAEAALADGYRAAKA
jgi:hypothetical protein